jgi:hypothetical protein
MQMTTRPEMEGKNYWGELFALRDEQRARQATGIQVVRGKDLPLECNRQGLMRWYLHPAIRDTILSTLMFYKQEIPPGSRSGRFKFQGGQVMYILAGRGHTLLDGVKHPWAAGDVLNLPLKRDGIIVQHFNDDPAARAVFLACEPNLTACTGVDRGSGFEQIEESPDYGADHG